MQYVRSISGSVSKTWNSINPATLSGAIDVIVVELEDGSLACSPFHVRFGKFSLLRPYEKKVEFWVNDVKQDFAMKLGEEGEAFFVFETSDDIPDSLQTSPLVSPVLGPKRSPGLESTSSSLQEPEFLDLSSQTRRRRSNSNGRPQRRAPWLAEDRRAQSYTGELTAISKSAEASVEDVHALGWEGKQAPYASLHRSESDHVVAGSARADQAGLAREGLLIETNTRPLPEVAVSDPSPTAAQNRRSRSPPPLPTKDALHRAVTLSKKLSVSNIRSKVNERGDLMLDMTGYKTSEDEAIRAELIARRLLAEEIQGNYDIGALIGADEDGNIWVYSSEEAKEAADRPSGMSGVSPQSLLPSDAASDPGHQSDGERSTSPERRPRSSYGIKGDAEARGLMTPPRTPPDDRRMAESRNYAKTLRLTSEQLDSLGLKPGINSMRFSVNKATCTAHMYFWKHNASIVISDIDGTITKSDALGHVLNMIGRDWTHQGVAKLYSDIEANGYHILYLTSRSIGQADTTRNYLNSVYQDNYKLPRGPVILSPDRTIAALRREVYLRKPEVFKMACLRDIHNLFGPNANPFYAGFGNRLTDALSYRTVTIPSMRIFTINSNAEVSLDLLSLSKYKSSYISMQELVNHFFPPIDLLVPRGGESYTDFNFWRRDVLDLAEFSASETEDDEGDRTSIRSEDEGSEGLDYGEGSDPLEASYLSQGSGDLQNERAQLEIVPEVTPIEEGHENGSLGVFDKPAHENGHVRGSAIGALAREMEQPSSRGRGRGPSSFAQPGSDSVAGDGESDLNDALERLRT